MICPKCNSQLDGGEKFCHNCGANLEEVNKTLQGNNKNKKDKSLIVVIILLVIMFGFIGLGVYFGVIIYNLSKANISFPSGVADLSPYQLIKKDYDVGNISKNEYFKQLVYLEYDDSKLDSRYSSLNKQYITNCQVDLDRFFEENYESFDEDIIRFYLINRTLGNVSLGNGNLSTTSNNEDKKVEKLDGDLSNIVNHQLNKVTLTDKGRFLIWYSDVGNDGISDFQLNELKVGLENSVDLYQNNFKINYSYNPYIDNKIFNDDFKNAKKVLEENNIDPNVLKTAMSVYVYDTGSESVLATYSDEANGAKIINRSLFFDILDKDGIVNYPYIVINRRGFNDKDSLKELYNHELFHHFQYIYCKSNSNERCSAGLELTEGMANFASSMASTGVSDGAFLNDWAEVYVGNTSENLTSIKDDGGSVGYGLYPYFDAYSKNVSNWYDVLIKAHLEDEPFDYIMANTSKEDLRKTIKYLGEYSLTQRYNNLALRANNMVISRALGNGTYNENVKPGAINYYKFKKANVKVENYNKENITVSVFGRKNALYVDLGSLDSFNTNDYNNKYDEFYLVIGNGNLKNRFSYKLIVSTAVSNNKSKKEEKDTKENLNDDVINNYRIRIDTEMDMGGITTKSISRGVVDEKNQKEYLKVTSSSSVAGMEVETEIYSDFISGYSYTKTDFSNNWLKDKSNAQRVDIVSIQNKLRNGKNVKKISSNHYSVKMSKDEIGELLTNNSVINGDILVDVYIDNSGYISKLEYNFSDLADTITKLVMTVELSDYNMAGNVEIPRDIY